jgi:hypothetical protein
LVVAALDAENGKAPEMTDVGESFLKGLEDPKHDVEHVSVVGHALARELFNYLDNIGRADPDGVERKH